MLDSVTLARDGDGAAFERLIEPHRRELFVHCYRILGSIQDAEDALQETMVAAWTGLAGFEGRASVRTWLYRIATNRCLNALRDQRSRRPAAPAGAKPEPTGRVDPIWLQPFPDHLLEGVPDDAPGPDARYELKETVALAFVSGLQRLVPHQRAVLVLRDALGYRAAEVAEMLDVSLASVNSALLRARAAMDQGPRRRLDAALPAAADQRRLMEAFAHAFEHGDVDGVVALLHRDAWLRMPPQPHEYRGQPAIRDFLCSRAFVGRGGTRLVPTRANGLPAFVYYVPDPDAGVLDAGGLLLVTVDGELISTITRFGDTGVLPYFGLPTTRPLQPSTAL